MAVGDGLGRAAVAVGLTAGGKAESEFPSRMTSVMPTMISSTIPQARTSGLRIY
ncbi:MAG TPA: hypothetical protein VG104_05540 [Candidatus Dormibacteraeota bacterium]|nr:hypothetical protein [Candidatus Dormibacteraeota bacterium]